MLALTFHRYYYQYDKEQLSTCTLTIHGLLHIPTDIRCCGPVWTTWVFYMERFCSLLQSGLRSRQHPWGNLNKCNLHLAYLWQLSAKYHIENKLKPMRYRDKKTIQCNEQVYPECECACSESMAQC